MRRAVFFLVYDPDGLVGEHVTHHLRALRPHADEIAIVSNSALTTESRVALEAVADSVWERENTGFDVGAYRDILERHGDRLADFDEIVLMNYTFYGPIGSYDELFARMDATDVDFWGVTDHAAVQPHPYTGTGTMPRHIQSHWIAVRRRMATSDAWREYWSTMPVIDSYEASIVQHESRFTGWFEERGYRSATAFPAADYGAQHPIFDVPARMIDDGLPIVKRRLFFHDPLYHDGLAVMPRDVEDRMVASGYPMELVYRDMARTSKPRDLATNLATLEIMPDVDTGDADVSGLRIGVLAHLYYDEMLEEILVQASRLPAGWTLIATTDTDEKRDRLVAALDAAGRTGDEVRVVESNRGRDVSAFLLGCRDVLRSDRFDLIVKLHSKRSPQNGAGPAAHFKAHLFENLLGSPGYVRNLLRLFVERPALGMVFPPMIHSGFPTMGRGWFANREPATRLAAQLGIRVPIDDRSPLAPYGSMFIARPEALRLLVDADFAWEDFPTEGGYEDGGLPHTLERLFGYAALGAGFEVRNVMTARNAAVSYMRLEYKLDAMSDGVPGWPIEQIAWVQAHVRGSKGIEGIKRAIADASPRTARVLLVPLRAARVARRGARRVLGR